MTYDKIPLNKNNDKRFVSYGNVTLFNYVRMYVCVTAFRLRL